MATSLRYARRPDVARCVDDAHHLVHLLREPAGDAVRGSGEDLLFENSALRRGEKFEDVAHRLPTAGRAADANPQPGNFLRAERLDDAPEPLVAGGAAGGSDAEDAEREVNFVIDDEDAPRRHLVPADQLPDADTGVVHVRLRPCDDDGRSLGMAGGD